MIIGIDPGFTGAIALVDGKRVWAADLPITLIKNKKEICVTTFIDILRDIGVRRIQYAVVEDVHARPGQAAGAMWRFSYNAGILFGVLRAFDIKVIRVSPQVWKPGLGLNSDKNKSLELARELYPNYKKYFKRKKDDGRAEALLLAHFAKECLE